MNIVPETTSAGGLVLNPNNKLLIVQEFGEYWGLPRGHLNKDESEIDAAIREIESYRKFRGGFGSSVRL